MIKFPLEHYVARRDEDVAAASATKLPNAKKRHLEAAVAWQQIIDRFEKARSVSTTLTS